MDMLAFIVLREWRYEWSINHSLYSDIDVDE